mmetsp:Transcript_9361/g.26858  ORF Transcript_9361/g.26858 Transcript_9361/m.26858 type:complete len:132 (+) Transcript_9361:228-623(+)
MLQDLAILLLLGRLIHKLFQAHSMVSHSPNLKQYTGTHATLEMTTGFNSRRIHTLDVVGHVALPRPVLDVDARQLLGLLASVREGLQEGKESQQPSYYGEIEQGTDAPFANPKRTTSKGTCCRNIWCPRAS